VSPQYQRRVVIPDKTQYQWSPLQKQLRDGATHPEIVDRPQPSTSFGQRLPHTVN